MYHPENPPTSAEELPRWLYTELLRLAGVLQGQQRFQSVAMLYGTDTTAGASATLNTAHGRFRVSAGTATFTLTNSRIHARDTVLALPCQNDATGRVLNAVPADGSVVIKLTAPTANMDVMFAILQA